MALDALRQRLISLHAAKSKAYGNAWKNRGEVLSILANIARKIDRLEVLIAAPQHDGDEPLEDTAIDLLVYCMKYQTFLADLEPQLAQHWFGPERPPYSDGTRGFDALIRRHAFAPPQDPSALVPRIASQFQALERCFDGLQEKVSALKRGQEAERLSFLAGSLVLALIAEEDRGSPSLRNHAEGVSRA